MMVCTAHFSVFTVQCLSFIGVQIHELCISRTFSLYFDYTSEGYYRNIAVGKKNHQVMLMVMPATAHSAQFPKINASDDSKPRKSSKSKSVFDFFQLTVGKIKIIQMQMKYKSWVHIHTTSEQWTNGARISRLLRIFFKT